MSTIGVMAAGTAGPVEGFKAKLSELGFVEGQVWRAPLDILSRAVQMIK